MVISNQDVDMYLTSLAQQTPWVVFCFDKKLEKIYRKQLSGFAQRVRERRAITENAATLSSS